MYQLSGHITSHISIHRQLTHLVPGGVVDLGGQALGLGLTGEQVLRLVQTQTENLSVQVVVLVPQLVVLLREQTENSFQRGLDFFLRLKTCSITLCV